MKTTTKMIVIPKCFTFEEWERWNLLYLKSIIFPSEMSAKEINELEKLKEKKNHE